MIDKLELTQKRKLRMLSRLQSALPGRNKVAEL